jgi:hypothetical protein
MREIFFLVNEKEKNTKIVQKERIFAVTVWIEFQTRFQMPGLSLKLGPFFFRLCVFENDRKLGLSLKLDPISLDRILNSVSASC